MKFGSTETGSYIVGPTTINFLGPGYDGSVVSIRIFDQRQGILDYLVEVQVENTATGGVEILNMSEGTVLARPGTVILNSVIK